MKFRVYINNTMDGPFAVAELWQLPGFSLDCSVCPDGEFSWQPASQYPVITRFAQQATSGDYNPGEVPPDAVEKITSQNWRQAVIGEEVPEIKSAPAPSLTPSPVLPKKPLKSSPEPLAKIKKLASSLGEHRRGILLLLLGFVSVGVYYPETENLAEYLSDISVHQAAMETMGNRFRQLGSPHAGGLWKHKTNRYRPAPGDKVAPAVPTAPPTPEVIEIGSEDLGNGMVSKTIVVTEIRDGVRVQQTKTIEVPAHPHRSKRKKALKPGSAQLPNHVTITPA